MVAAESMQPIGNRFRGTDGNDEALTSIADQISSAYVGSDDDWQAACHRLSDYKPKRFTQRREHEYIHLHHQVEHLAVRQRLEPAHAAQRVDQWLGGTAPAKPAANAIPLDDQEDSQRENAFAEFSKA